MPRLPLPRPWLGLTAALLTALLSAAPARAEEGAGPQDPRAKLKAQVEKILKLMHENDRAAEARVFVSARTPVPPAENGRAPGGASAG